PLMATSYDGDRVGSTPPPLYTVRSVEEHPGVDVEDLAGDAVRAAERHHLVGHVLDARRAVQHRALERPAHDLRTQARGHPGAVHQPGRDAVHAHLGGHRHRQASREVDEPGLAGGVADAAAAGIEPGHRGDVHDAARAARLEV